MTGNTESRSRDQPEAQPDGDMECAAFTGVGPDAVLDLVHQSLEGGHGMHVEIRSAGEAVDHKAGGYGESAFHDDHVGS